MHAADVISSRTLTNDLVMVNNRIGLTNDFDDRVGQVTRRTSAHIIFNET